MFHAGFAATFDPPDKKSRWAADSVTGTLTTTDDNKSFCRPLPHACMTPKSYTGDGRVITHPRHRAG